MFACYAALTLSNSRTGSLAYAADAFVGVYSQEDETAAARFGLRYPYFEVGYLHIGLPFGIQVWMRASALTGQYIR